MIQYQQNFGSKSVAASVASILSFGSDFIPGTGVRAYTVNMTGTAFDYDSLDRIRLKAGGQTFWDVDENHHRAMVQAMSPSNFDYANSDTYFEIPMYFTDRYKNDPARWACGFPNGATPTLELSQDGTPSGAPVATIGYLYDDNPAALPSWYPMFIGNDTNAGANANRSWTPITQKGYLAGFSFVLSGLTSFELVIGGKTILNLLANHILALALANGNVDAYTTVFFMRLEEPVLVLPGSGFYITGGAGWLTTNQIGLLTWVPQGA